MHIMLYKFVIMIVDVIIKKILWNHMYNARQVKCTLNRNKKLKIGLIQFITNVFEEQTNIIFK